MNKKWGYFAGASLLAAYLLVTRGAPLVPVLAGIAGVALYLRRTSPTA